MVPEEVWHDIYKQRTIIGLTEEIVIFGDKEMKIRARIDTGATRNSIDADIVKELNLGPVVKKKIVKQAYGHEERPVILVGFELAGKKLEEEFTIAKRGHMKYSVLIGQNSLRNGFLIDPNIK